jgi:hypothetical protein
MTDETRMTLDTRLLQRRAGGGPVGALLLCCLLGLRCTLPHKEPGCRVPEECGPGLACVDGHCRVRAASGDGAAATGSGGSAGGLNDGGPAGAGGESSGDVGAGDGPAGPDAAEDATADLDAAMPAADAGDAAARSLSVVPITHYFELSSDGSVMFNTAAIVTADWLAPPPTPAVKLEDVTGPLPSIDDLEAHAMGLDVYLMARVGSTTYLTAMRDGEGTPWEQIADHVAAMGLTNIGPQLVACLVSSSGSLLVGERQASGAWHFDDVSNLVRPNASDQQPSGFGRLDCAGVGPRLELLVLDDQGRLWNATRKPEAWTRLSLIDQLLVLKDVDAVNSAGELNVLAASASTQYHRVKLGDQWTVFADVEREVRSDVPGMVVASSMASLYAGQIWVQLNSLGQVWLDQRSLTAQWQYWQTPSLTGSPKSIVVAVTLP